MTPDLSREAVERLARYVAMREAKPLANLGDYVHRIHSGTEWEAELLFSDLLALSTALAAAQTDLAIARADLENGGAASKEIAAERDAAVAALAEAQAARDSQQRVAIRVMTELSAQRQAGEEMAGALGVISNSAAEDGASVVGHVRCMRAARTALARWATATQPQTKEGV